MWGFSNNLCILACAIERETCDRWQNVTHTVADSEPVFSKYHSHHRRLGARIFKWSSAGVNNVTAAEID